MESDKPKVFVSYSSSNGDFAELLKMKLEDAGIEVWKDNYQILAGKEWRNEIDSGLLSSQLILVLLNKNSTNSPYVTYEWAFALGSGKPVIPILLEECEIHPRINVLQYMDFKDQKRPWDKLTERIKNSNIRKSSQTVKVSELTVEELEKILSGSKSLANAKAKSEGREIESGDITEAANQLVNAKNYLNSISDKPNTILWVDDRPNNNIYERSAFETLGFKFDLALSTKEALTKISKNKYAAIISDMGRVEGPKEGYVLLKEVRKKDKQIPYFIYAGSNLAEHKIEAQEKGAQGSTNRADELIDLVTTHVQSKFELKFVVPSNKKEKLAHIIRDIKKLEGSFRLSIDNRR
jgi:CheY-like chemotaxis protein